MSLSGIPNSFSQPGVWVNLTVNDSTSSNDTFNVLIIGQAAANANYATNPALYPITTLTQLASDFGTTSDVYKIVSEYKSIDTTTSIYALNAIVGQTSVTQSNGTVTTINTVLETTSQTSDMAGSSVAATGGTGSGATFNITSTPNSSSTAWTPASIALSAGGSGYSIGDKLTIANVGTITVTGLDSETVTVNQTDLTVIENALTNLGNTEIDLILGLYNSADAIEAFDNYFTGTWGYAEERWGHYITVEQSDSVTSLIASSANFNKETVSAIAIPTDMDQYITLGSAGAQIALRTQSNPSLPLRSFSIDAGTVSITDRWNASTRNTLFTNGYCTIACDTAGNPVLERTRIGATTDTSGMAINDTSLETRFQAVYCAKAVRSAFTPYTSNPKIIMADSDVVEPSTYVVTPKAVRGTAIATYRQLVTELVATDIATFKSNLVVEIDPDVNGRIDVVYPITLASGLNQITINLSVTK